MAVPMTWSQVLLIAFGPPPLYWGIGVRSCILSISQLPLTMGSAVSTPKALW